jgi:hypothetical protein
MQPISTEAAPMETLHLCIKWHYPTEYIDIDTGSLPHPGQYLETWEYWPDEAVTIRYNVRCLSATLEGDRLTVSLKYDPDLNPNLVERCYWGISTIEVDLQARIARATWTDDTDKTRDGTTEKCRVHCEDIFEEVARRSAQVNARPEQAVTRRILLDQFGECALTGEKTPAVLDVAHVNAAEIGGKASVANCILLRTDVHRLWDSGLLSIDVAGTASLKGEVSDRYRDELSGKALGPKVLKHVRAALKRSVGWIGS